MDDWTLLDDYARRNSEAAFKELVSRYLNLVYSAALRQVQQTQLAEEVAQAVFVLLARKAGTMPRNVVLAGWLFRTTRFVASRALRTELRRQKREQESFDMQNLSSSDDDWKQIAPVLDEAMEKLGQGDRDALVLRFFQGKSLKEVGDGLAISEEAAKKRVARGLEKLRVFFRRRGFTISAVALGTVLGAHGVEAAPAAGMALAQSVLASGAKNELAQEALRAWKWAKIKLAALATVASILLVGTLVLPMTTHHGGTAKANSETSGAGLLTAKPQETGGAHATNNAPAGPVFTIHVVEAETGRGIAGAKIRAFVVSVRKVNFVSDLVTDDAGSCAVPLGEGEIGRLDVGALKDGYVAKFYTWRIDKMGAMVPEHTLALERAVMTGGWVRNEQGEPVGGAEIAFTFDGVSDSDVREFKSERLGFLGSLPVAISGTNGYWSCSLLPANYAGIRINVVHPRFQRGAWWVDGDVETARDGWVTLADLSALRAVFVLERGTVFLGRVVDEENNPVPGASVALDGNEPQAKTDFQGLFTLTKLNRTKNQLRNGARLPLTVTADGFAPSINQVPFNADTNPVVFKLTPGALLRVKVVDQSERALDDACVVLSEVDRMPWMGGDQEALTDASGCWKWAHAPKGSLGFDILRKGFLIKRNVSIAADGIEHVVKLQPEFKVSGAVVDAETGEPIAKFKAIPGNGSIKWDRGKLVNATNGWFELVFTEQQPEYLLRIEAEGYEPAIRDSIEAADSVVNVSLTKLSTNSISGTVLLPDGSPAAGAQVALGTTENEGQLWLGQAKLLRRNGLIITNTDAQGAFRFTPQPNAVYVVAVHAAGIARAIANTNGAPQTMQLEPWGRIEGAVTLRAENLKGVSVWNPGDGPPMSNVQYEVSQFRSDMDANGHFAIENVPAGLQEVMLDFGIGKPTQLVAWAEVEPGKTALVQIRENGCRVSGRFVSSDGQTNWVRQTVFVALSSSDSAAGHSPAGEAHVKKNKTYQTSVNEDGSFTIYCVPPRDYELRGIFQGDGAGDQRWRYVNKPVTVPEGTGQLDLGEVLVK